MHFIWRNHLFIHQAEKVRSLWPDFSSSFFSVSKGVVVQLNCWVLIFWGYRGLKKVVSYLGLIEVQYGRKNIVLNFIIIHLKSSAILG